MEIRTAKASDALDIVRLLKQVAKVHHDLRPDLFKEDETKYNHDEVVNLLNHKQYFVNVADDGGQVVGYIIGILKQPELDVLVPIKTMYIDDLCVDENYRGQAIGRKLYEHILNIAKKEECYNITLNVWASNDATEFYESLNLKIQKIGMEYII